MLRMSSAVTRGVKVQVESEYVVEKSSPEKGVYFFAYHVVISNEGNETVQLLSRHWTITGETGRVEEVRGPGVVGEQPALAPGEAFEYSSFCSLDTPFGMMQGTFTMVTEDGLEFEAEIAPFTLTTGKITLH